MRIIGVSNFLRIEQEITSECAMEARSDTNLLFDSGLIIGFSFYCRSLLPNFQSVCASATDTLILTKLSMHARFYNRFFIGR